MKRTDIVMTPYLENFLKFDLGHMNTDLYPGRVADVVYSDGLKLDLYYPEQINDKNPLVISIFGGGWISGFKTDKFVPPMIQPINEGFIVAVPDYTLSLDAPFPQSVIDIKKCIAFLRSHSDLYKIDTNNITLWGESAGAHLALEAGLVENSHFDLALDTRVKNIIAMYAPSNPLAINAQAEKLDILDTARSDKDTVFGIYMGKNYDDERQMNLASPIKQINDHMPNIILEHGTKDALVPYLQSVEFFNKAKEKYPDSHVTLSIYDGLQHTDPFFFTKEHVHYLMNMLK
ncbi:MAG: alpha/beta hydrolase [Bulleidia sp.]|nr:alpha/beta hydrolase [Erysipelotrichaceae bacterium]MDY2781610.1 alpha/beta hydrolase [Bulleidia sp.]